MLPLYFPLIFSGTIYKEVKSGSLVRNGTEVRRAGKERDFSFYNLSVQFEFTIYVYYF